MDIIKRQKTSQKSFTSLFNTLSRVRAPPNPAIKNDTTTALFTTWNHKKVTFFQCPVLKILCLIHFTQCHSTINEHLKMDWMFSTTDTCWVNRFFTLYLRLSPLYLHCCGRQERHREESQGMRLGTSPHQCNQPYTHTRNCTVFYLF